MNPTRLKVLCTGGGGAGSEALQRLWSDRYELHFADADVAGIAPLIPADRCHGIPMAGDSWAGAVAALCRRLSIDVLVPGVDEELPLVSAMASAAPAVLPLVPHAGFVARMMDKLQCMRSLDAAGIDVPRTRSMDQIGDIGFPCLVKPRTGRGSRGVQILKSAAEAGAYQLLSGQLATDILAQELLQGQEWTVYVSANRNGALRCVVPVRVGVKRGITVRAETAAHPGIIAYCRTIHERFPTPGPYNVQLMETTDGRLAAFEINPRVSTTLCLAIAAGADPIADLFSDGSTTALRPFTPGMRLHRYWLNYIGQG